LANHLVSLITSSTMNNSTETNFILCVQLENDNVFAKFTPCQINDAYTVLCDKEMFHNHMDEETFKTDVIVFNQLHYNVFEVTPTDNFQCQSVC
jgi:hypothetical protein